MLEKLLAIIKEDINIDVSDINEESVLRSDMGINSLELVQLISDIEDEFEIEIPDRAIRSFRTVGDVVSFIESATK